MSVFEEPSRGSVQRTYRPAGSSVWASGSSSDTTATTSPVDAAAPRTVSLPTRSSFFCASPVTLLAPAKPRFPASAARRTSRASARAAVAIASTSRASSAPSGFRPPNVAPRCWASVVPLWLLAAPGVAEEAIDGVETGARKDPLDAHVPVLSGQVAVEVDLRLVGRREVGVPALGGERVATAPDPHEAGLPESGAGGDDGGIALRVGPP